MKYILLVLSGVCCLVSSNSFATSSGWADKPLQVQNAQPEPLGERTLPVQEVKYNNSTYSVSDKSTSFNIAYS